MSFLFFLLISCVLLVSAEIAKRKFKQSVNVTRKIAHVGASLIAVLSPLFVSKGLIVIACFAFAGILFLSRRTALFSSVQSIKRNTLGEVFLPLGEALTALLFLPQGIKEFQYGVIVMGLSDPLAGFIGEKFGKHEITIFGGKKSIEGACAFFLCTLLLTYSFSPVISFQLLFIPFVLTLIELFLGYGLDNLVLPIAGAYLLKIMNFVY